MRLSRTISMIHLFMKGQLWFVGGMKIVVLIYYTSIGNTQRTVCTERRTKPYLLCANTGARKQKKRKKKIGGRLICRIKEGPN